MSTQDEMWNVALRGGEVRSMTLDELDAAFEAGAINGNTLVLAPGTTAWVRLGTAAGLNDAAPVAAAPPSAPSMPPPVAAPYSVAPIAMDNGPTFGGGDLDFDLPRQGPKNRGPLYLIGGLLAAGIAIVAMTSSDAPPGSIVTAAATQPPAAAPLPPPVATTPAQPATTTASQRAQLNDEQRKALLDADKSRDAQHRAKVGARSGGAVRNSGSYKSDNPFNAGGDAHDPLNGKL